MILYACKKRGRPYTKQDLQHLNDVHPDFHDTGVYTVDSRDGPIYGHLPGGVCIVWRGKFHHCVIPIEFDLDWLTGIYFCQDGRTYAVLCVYLPFECPVNEETYLEKLGVFCVSSGHSYIRKLLQVNGVY